VLCPAEAEESAEGKEKKKKKSKKDMSSLFDALGGDEGAANGVEPAAEVSCLVSDVGVRGSDGCCSSTSGTCATSYCASVDSTGVRRHFTLWGVQHCHQVIGKGAGSWCGANIFYWVS
jgi:hypothetical protein